MCDVEFLASPNFSDLNRLDSHSQLLLCSLLFFSSSSLPPSLHPLCFISSLLFPLYFTSFPFPTFLHSYLHSFLLRFLPSFFLSSILLYCVTPFIHSFLHLFICTFIHSFIHLFLHSFFSFFIPLFLHFFIHLFLPLILISPDGDSY